MPKEIENPLEGGVHLTQDLPLAWHRSEFDDGLKFESIMFDNEALLGNQHWLEEFEHALYDEVPRGDHEDAIEVRLDLLVSLVGMWMRRQFSPPPSVPVTLDEENLSWVSLQPPELGAQLLVELYLVPRFPMPLILPCEVVDMASLGEGEGWCTNVRLLHLSDRTRQGISRAVFRCHRRVLRNRRSHMHDEESDVDTS